MKTVLKYLATALIIFFGMFGMIFCFDSPDWKTNLKLVSYNLLIIGVLLWLVWRKWS